MIKQDRELEKKGEAKIVKARRISLVWLIPLLALIVTLALIYKNTIEKGPAIEVTISSAEGIEAGRTLVKMRSVTVGRVENVRLDESYSQAVLSIQMEPDTEELLNEDSLFWLVKPRVETAGISGLDTLLSGSYLQISKGHSPHMATSFKALDEPPPQLGDMKGVTLNLYSQAKKRLSSGDIVTFRGFTVGRVLAAHLDAAENKINYQVFIDEPYDQLLNANTRFWITSGLDFELSTEGLKVSTDSVDSILRGGMSFDNLNDDLVSKPLDVSQELELFENQNLAQADAMRTGLLYVIFMDGGLRNIRQGSGVFFNSVKIGEVIEAPWFESYEELFANSLLPVLIGLNFSGEEREYVNGVLQQNADRGRLCASVSSSSIISGDNRINLSFADVDHKCAELSYRGLLAFKASTSISIDDRLNAISRSIDDMDLAGVSQDLRKSLNSFSEAMQAFTRSNDEVKRLELLPRMTTAFERFNLMLRSYDDQSEFYRNMESTLNDIRQVLQDLKPAMVQLGQKPSSIIYGSSSEEVIPRARKEENK